MSRKSFASLVMMYSILLIVIERRNAHGIQSAHGWSRFPKGTESSLVDGGSGGERSLPLAMGDLGTAWRLPRMVIERPNVQWYMKARYRMCHKPGGMQQGRVAGPFAKMVRGGENRRFCTTRTHLAVIVSDGFDQ